MAMTAGGSSGGVQSDINVTPMIDVLLVLLIIFMITQPLSRMAMDVQVPPPDETDDHQDAAQPDRARAGRRRQLRDQRAAGPQGPARYPDPRDLRSAAGQAAVHQGRRRTGSTRTSIEAMDVARGAGVQIIGFTPKEANARSRRQPLRTYARGDRASVPARAFGAPAARRLRAGAVPTAARYLSPPMHPSIPRDLRARQPLSTSPFPPRAAATAACCCRCCSTSLLIALVGPERRAALVADARAGRPGARARGGGGGGGGGSTGGLYYPAAGPEPPAMPRQTPVTPPPPHPRVGSRAGRDRRPRRWRRCPPPHPRRSTRSLRPRRRGPGTGRGRGPRGRWRHRRRSGAGNRTGRGSGYRPGRRRRWPGWDRPAARAPRPRLPVRHAAEGAARALRSP